MVTAAEGSFDVGIGVDADGSDRLGSAEAIVRGAPVVIPLRAGIEVAEWAYDRPDTAGRIAHGRPAEIAFRRPDVFPIDGSHYDLYFYYAERDFGRHMRVDRIEIRYLHDQGGIEVYGLGIYNFDTGETSGMTRQMRPVSRLG